MFGLSLAGRLDFRHRGPTEPPLPPGRHDLGLFATRDAVLIVPEGIDAARPTPFMVMFHGGGGTAEKILPVMHGHAEADGFLLLVRQSMLPTWDIIIAGNGPDRERLAIALAEARFALAEHPMAAATRSRTASPTAMWSAMCWRSRPAS